MLVSDSAPAVSSAGLWPPPAAPQDGAATCARPKSRIFAWPRVVTKNVRRLDVTVDDALRARRLQPVGNLDPQFQHLLDLQPSGGQPLAQRLAFQALHGDEEPAFLLPDFVNRAYAGMIQRRGGLGLALETIERLAIVRQFVREEFQCNEALQARVLGLVHHAHAPAAKFSEDAIVREGLPDHCCHAALGEAC